ncbi:MAG: adenosine kinase [Bacteroidota bacterium]
MQREIDVCGIGNALVDLQYQIEEKDIKTLGVHKGEMRLVDAHEQQEIISRLDAGKFNKCSGGSAANTIIAFSQFGGKAAYLTSLGNDELGKFYSQEFLDLRIELQTRFLDENPTGTCLVLITPDAERTMLTSLGASAKINTSNISEELIKKSKWIYIEGYLFSQQESTDAVLEAVRLAKKFGTKVSVTFSDVFITNNFNSALKEVVSQSDLVFCNEAEVFNFTDKNNFDEALDELNSFSKNIVITRGSKGSSIKWVNQVYEIEPFKTKSIDTTGAGDMYAGAFLYGLIYFKSIEKAGKLASYSASKIVSQYGARLVADFDELIKTV